mgnify:CR=1 FL=1|jgi:hypothetical protein
MQKYPVRYEKNEISNSLTHDGKLALGIFIGTIAALFIYLLAESYLGKITAIQYLNILPIVVSLLVAGGSTYFASRALLEQRRTREAGTDPVLIAHLGQREDARELITFNISNVGAGAALNVQVDVKKPDVEIEKFNILTNIFKRHHPFTVILQGKSVEFSLALGWNVLGETPLDPFCAKISYEDLAGGQYESLFWLDVRELEGLGANKSPMMRAVAALEKIAKT